MAKKETVPEKQDAVIRISVEVKLEDVGADFTGVMEWASELADKCRECGHAKIVMEIPGPIEVQL